MWGNIVVGFGGLLLIAIIGFIVAWRDLERQRRERQQRRGSEQDTQM